MMEQEELELVKRLQNTPMMQKTAFYDLENALKGSFIRKKPHSFNFNSNSYLLEEIGSHAYQG